MRHWKHQTEAG